MKTITLSELHAVTYSLDDGEKLSSVKIKTISKLKSLLKELDITDRNIYLKALRLLNKGESIPAALSEVLK